MLCNLSAQGQHLFSNASRWLVSFTKLIISQPLSQSQSLQIGPFIVSSTFRASVFPPADISSRDRIDYGCFRWATKVVVCTASQAGVQVLQVLSAEMFVPLCILFVSRGCVVWWPGLRVPDFAKGTLCTSCASNHRLGFLVLR